MSRTLELYEDAKRLHDNFEGLYLYGQHTHQSLLRKQSKKKALYFKTCSVILQDRYLNEQEDEDLDNHVPVVTNVVK